MNRQIRIIIIGALVLVFAGAILLRESQRRSAATAGKTTPGETAGMVPGGSPGTRPQSGAPAPATLPLPRLVDLGSTTCVPCKMMAPILEELSREYQGQFAVDVIDVRANRSAAELYTIRVIPTQIFLDAAGQERFRHEGFMAKDAILAKWAELGVNLQAPAPAGQAG